MSPKQRLEEDPIEITTPEDVLEEIKRNLNVKKDLATIELVVQYCNNHQEMLNWIGHLNKDWKKNDRNYNT